VRRTFPLDHSHGLPPDEVRTLVGGKAANLGVMLGPELRLPVPPGFVITTAACREFLAGGWPDGLDEELRERRAEVEAAVGRRFGDPSDPLLVSVRSGAPISMPGMMDTILNLGLNDATTDGLAAATGDEAFARDCRERFRVQFREIVGVGDAPEDAWRQLRLAIEAVFRSWNSDRAVAYRRREGLRDDLGTAVTVQAMVFGNRGPDSATGVVFTRNPATGEDALYGDVLFDAQGEDVVAGTHATEPIGALDARLPEVASALRDAATRLERHSRDLCDIEFTIERGRLWLLQTRIGKRSPQAALRIAVDMADDPCSPCRAARPSSGSCRCSSIRRGSRPPGAATCCRSRPACPPLRGWPAARSPRRPTPPSARRRPAGASSSSVPRPRPTTSTAWPGRPAS
jgi:pyruvate,orthophosphate dikinase